MKLDQLLLVLPVHVDPSIRSWKDVLIQLAYHADDLTGESWPSRETLARECGLKSAKQVGAALDGLVKLGLIERVEGARRKSQTYLLTTSGRNVDKLMHREVTSLQEGKSLPIDGKSLPSSVEVTSILSGSHFPQNKQEQEQLNYYHHNEPIGEVTSHVVDNSAEVSFEPQRKSITEKVAVAPGDYHAKGGLEKEPRKVSYEDIIASPDYNELCHKMGWRPNTATNMELAKKAVIACAFKEQLSPEKAKEFWKYNAVRKWSGIDEGVSVADLAHAFMLNWFKEDPHAFAAERARRWKLKHETTFGT